MTQNIPARVGVAWDRVEAGLFDTMIAHALIEPDMRHSLD